MDIKSKVFEVTAILNFDKKNTVKIDVEANSDNEALKDVKKFIRHKYNPYHIEITNCKFKKFKFQI